MDQAVKFSFRLRSDSVWLADLKPVSSGEQVQMAYINPDPLTHKYTQQANINGVRINGLTEVGKGTPDVFPFGKKGSARKYNSLSMNPVEMDEDMQLFAADLLSYQKYGLPFRSLPQSAFYAATLLRLPGMSAILSGLDQYQRAYIQQKYRAVYGNKRAYTNQQGYGTSPDRADFVSRRDTRNSLPKMFPLLDGTNTHAVREIDGDYVLLDTFTPGTIPSSYGIEILQDLRVSWCTNIKPNSSSYVVFQFPQLDGPSVPRPLFTREPAYYWKDEVEIYTGTRRPLYIPPRPGEP